LRSQTSQQFYPGAEWANFGEGAFNFATERLQAGQPLLSAISIELSRGKAQDNLVLKGWSRIMSAQSMLIWGQLTPFSTKPDSDTDARRNERPLY
jgi:hypothetical protein